MKLLPLLLMAGTALPAASADASALLRAEAAFARAAAERGAEGFLSFFAGEGSILPAKGPVVTGLPALRGAFSRTWGPGFSLTWKPLKAEVARSGDLGYTYGTYERKRRDTSGRTVTESGKYMTLWKKQPDGSWKVIADMGN